MPHRARPQSGTRSKLSYCAALAQDTRQNLDQAVHVGLFAHERRKEAQRMSARSVDHDTSPQCTGHNVVCITRSIIQIAAEHQTAATHLYHMRKLSQRLLHIGANLGSMLTPIGNPQNLYLYGKSGMSMAEFLLLMFPYTVVSLLLLVGWAVAVCRKQASSCIGALPEQPNTTADRKIILLDAVLFAVCLLAVVRVLPYGVAFAAVLVCTLCADRSTLRNVDYSLLLTFVAFFIFIGNLGRIPAFSGWLQAILAGREVLVAVLASQVTSNVPAALLLSGFTAETQALIIGTNLGGLGTLIASMASLISYRQIARELPQGKKQYFGLFTLSNLIFLAILLGVWFLLR